MALAEARALGVPAVIVPIAAPPERVIGGGDAFRGGSAERCVSDLSLVIR